MIKLSYPILITFAVFLLSVCVECRAAGGEEHLKNGLKAYQQEADFDKAVSELREAARLGLDHKADLIQAYLYLGFAHIGQGDRTSAEIQFAEAIKLDPTLNLDPRLHSTKTVAVFGEVKERLVDQLTVLSVPGGAEVYIDGQNLGTTPLRLNDILIGKHSLRVVKEFFQARELSVQVQKGKDNRISVELNKKGMEISITSQPPEAAIYVADKYEGRTPLSVKMTLDQELNVKLAKEEFLDKGVKLKLTEAGVSVSDAADAIPVEDGLWEVKISLKPAPAPGSLKLVSDPPGATAYLDGIDVGDTPLTIAKITPGTRRLRVAMPRFASVTREVEIISNQETAVEVALGGLLHILSIPTDAQVFIDEEYIGVTPLRTGRIPAGSHQLRLAKDKHKDKLRAVVVKEQEKEVSIRLLPLKGSVVVSSDPPGTVVYLDGELKGNTPLFIYGVMVGQHSLRLVKPGYQGWEKSITVGELEISWHFGKLKR